MSRYIITSSELYHYGVKGMKWGVRKEEYKSMNRQQKRATKEAFYKTEGGQRSLKATTHATVWGTILGTPLGGIIAGLTTNAIMNRKANELIASDLASAGKKLVDESNNKKISSLTSKNSDRTESKRVAAIKKRVTGQDSDGKPAFLMSQQELAQFSKQYEARRQSTLNRYHNASNAATKQRLQRELDQMENDYLSIVEQDYWYADD